MFITQIEIKSKLIKKITVEYEYDKEEIITIQGIKDTFDNYILVFLQDIQYLDLLYCQ